MNTEHEIVYVALNKLIESPHNVRKTRTNEGMQELQASILAHGVLKNLIVYETDKGKFAVAGGERRRAALKVLAKAKKISNSFAIPCLVRPEAEAVELSLAENLHVPMHPADQFEAFAQMLDDGKTVEDVAAHFGVAPLIVTRRMKLARVAPVIMQAYRDAKLSLEAVMAFTVSDSHAEQIGVYSELVQQQRGIFRNAIIRMLTHEKVETSDARFRFVGEEAYLAAGGAITRDLFDDEGGGYATDSALLERLALAKLALLTTQIEADGWKWVEPVLSFDEGMTRSYARISRKPVALSEEDGAKRDALAERLDRINEENGFEELEEGPVLDEYQKIEAELDELDSRASVFAADEKALAGGWLSLDYSGNPSFLAGYVRKEDILGYELLRRASSPQAAPGDDEDEQPGNGREDGREDRENVTPLPSPASGLSDALLTDLYAARTMALRLELANRPDIALRAVAHGLAVRILAHETSALTVTAREVYVPAIAHAHCPDDEAVQSRISHWKLRLSQEPAKLWDGIMALPEAQVLDLIAVCAAVSVDATYQKHGDHVTRQRMQTVDQLAEALDLNMAQHWTATAENFFGRVNKTAIQAAVTEAKGEVAARKLEGLKKPIMAAEAANVVSGSGWLPVILRTNAHALTPTVQERLAAE
jgi:ParB family chromosome partitioning protein